jgi:hypothetical protein
MKRIIITITIEDQQTLQAYDGIHPDLIRDDFLANPDSWLLDEIDIQVDKVEIVES